jgi:biotin transport system substrate-specific component
MHPSPKIAAPGISHAEYSIARQVVWTLGFSVLTAIAARLEIPHEPVPYTLQTLVILLAGGFLGWRNAAISQILYLVAGAAGLPVFALGLAGPQVLIGPTGGYLLAFPAAAALTGMLVTPHRSLARTALGMGAALLLIFVCGTIHLWAWYVRDVAAAVTAGFLTFSWWDLVKLGAASTFYHEVAKRWPRPGA